MPVPYFIATDSDYHAEEYEPYECFTCGIREDEEDLQDYEGSGIVFSSGSALAPETYLCHRCRRIFYEKQ